eukprot:CAMPEP_0115177042 /NCGR_PEP_ID=MMETSP0270-20121206/5177_1 /TAXON_ID=71861 /ORGANISM="Scrippsiella trochoidea, Strain CCMP3099" /LENGTH=46 /DNA_ID= /DNA_START= /DNA_END= /DNA_ORIENTATION=
MNDLQGTLFGTNAHRWDARAIHPPIRSTTAPCQAEAQPSGYGKFSW